MKEKQDNYEQEIEKTLASLDGTRRAEPAPFFYTRLMSKMQGRAEAAQWSFPLVWKAAIVVLLLVNGLTAYVLTRDEVSNDALEVLSEDYFDGTDDIYTLEFFQE